MGLKEFFITAPQPIAEVNVDAALAPVNSIDALGAPYFTYGQSATRAEAMGVPTIARARGIICSTVASLPLETKVKETNETVPSFRVINQPDPRITGAEFWAWIAEDLLFRPAAYARVLSRYADTGRIQSMERIAPERVEVMTNGLGTEIDAYRVDGYSIAPEDLVVFGNMQEGLLNRAGRTVRAAHALEKAAYDFALNPIPQIVLSSNGVQLPKDRVASLINAFKNKSSKAVTFLNADIKMDTIGYDPKNLQMNEARNYLALELCRAIGLPAWFAYAIGTLKVGSALALIAGIWFPAVIVPAAALISVLMLGALAMHVRVRDPLRKSLPALGMLVLCIGISGGALVV